MIQSPFTFGKCDVRDRYLTHPFSATAPRMWLVSGGWQRWKGGLEDELEVPQNISLYVLS